MKSGLRAYFDLIYSEFDCYPTWLPGTGIAVGDIGRISESGSFQRTGALADRAQLPPTRTEREPSQTVSTRGGITFSSGMTVKTDQVVQLLASAGATVDITFGGTAAAALILEEVTRHEFVDEQPVRALMNTMLAAGTLNPDEVVVTYVKAADSGVVATNYDASRGVDIEIDAAVGQGVLQVARVGSHLKIISQRGSQTVVTAQQDRPLTPVYRALTFRHNRNWWSFWHSWLEVSALIPTRSFGVELADPNDILPGLPSRAVPMGIAGTIS